MRTLTSGQWSQINDIIYSLHEERDITTLRRVFLRSVSDLIPHDKSFFDLGFQKETKTEFFDPVSLNMEDQFLEAYYREYMPLDTMYWFFSQEKINIYRESDYVSEAMWDTTLFFSGWLAPQNILYSAGTRVAHGEMLYGSVNLWRSREHGDFSDEELYILEILNRHLALRFHLQYPCGIRSKDRESNVDGFGQMYHLTPREREVARLIYDGLSIKEIAEKLYISESTVKKHSNSLFAKTKSAGRSQLVRNIRSTLFDL